MRPQLKKIPRAVVDYYAPCLAVAANVRRTSKKRHPPNAPATLRPGEPALAVALAARHGKPESQERGGIRRGFVDVLANRSRDGRGRNLVCGGSHPVLLRGEVKGLDSCWEDAVGRVMFAADAPGSEGDGPPHGSSADFNCGS